MMTRISWSRPVKCAVWILFTCVAVSSVWLGLSQALLKFSGGSVDILRDVLC